MPEYSDPEKSYTISYPEGWLPLTHEGSPHVSLASLTTGGYLKVEACQFEKPAPESMQPERALQSLIECEKRTWPDIDYPLIQRGSRNGSALAYMTFTRVELPGRGAPRRFRSHPRVDLHPRPRPGPLPLPLPQQRRRRGRRRTGRNHQFAGIARRSAPRYRQFHELLLQPAQAPSPATQRPPARRAGLDPRRWPDRLARASVSSLPARTASHGRADRVAHQSARLLQRRCARSAQLQAHQAAAVPESVPRRLAQPAAAPHAVVAGHLHRRRHSRQRLHLRRELRAAEKLVLRVARRHHGRPRSTISTASRPSPRAACATTRA